MSPGPVLTQGDERGSEHVRKAGSVHGDVAGSHPVDCLAVSMVFRGSFSIALISNLVVFFQFDTNQVPSVGF